MNCILDTQAFLWSMISPERLSDRAGDVIRDPRNTVYVSVVTFWEIALKYSAGKLELAKVLPDDFPSVAKRAGFDVLPLTETEAATFYQLARAGHKDPFDRMIIWQAISRKLRLISNDASFSVYRESGLKIIW